MYYYVVYEDKFALYLCIILNKGVVDECVCIQRINKAIGRCEDGTLGSLCSELAEDSEAWKNWRHSELVPSLMFTREIAGNYIQIAVATNPTDWTYLNMSNEAKLLIQNGECSECQIQDGEDHV